MSKIKTRPTYLKGRLPHLQREAWTPGSVQLQATLFWKSQINVDQLIHPSVADLLRSLDAGPLESLATQCSLHPPHECLPNAAGKIPLAPAHLCVSESTSSLIRYHLPNICKRCRKWREHFVGYVLNCQRFFDVLVRLRSVNDIVQLLRISVHLECSLFEIMQIKFCNKHELQFADGHPRA